METNGPLSIEPRSRIKKVLLEKKIAFGELDDKGSVQKVKVNKELSIFLTL